MIDQPNGKEAEQGNCPPEKGGAFLGVQTWVSGKHRRVIREVCESYFGL